MSLTTPSRLLVGVLATLLLLQAGCATLAQDTRVASPAPARHCDGSEFISNTYMAVLPIPLVAFVMPRIATNSPDSSKFLARCGGRQQVNRNVEANYAVCVPTIFLTTIITLGIAGVCPTHVHWEADVVD